MDLNVIVFSGRLTSDAQSGMTGTTNYVRFSVANSNFKKETTFFDVTMWGSRASSITQYLTKGKTVIVKGSIACREYEKLGEKRKAWGVTAEDVQFIGNSSMDGNKPQKEKFDDSDVPFDLPDELKDKESEPFTGYVPF